MANMHQNPLKIRLAQNLHCPSVLVHHPQTLEICSQNATNYRRMGANISDRELGGITMRILIVCAIALTATIGLGGCFFHGGWHQQAVTTQPLK
jgi:hypothetical protein